jgi:hypothetical protein
MDWDNEIEEGIITTSKAQIPLHLTQVCADKLVLRHAALHVASSYPNPLQSNQLQ